MLTFIRMYSEIRKSFKIIVSYVDSYFSKDMELSWLGAGVYLQDPYDPNFDLQVESIDRLKLPQTFRKLTSILKLNYLYVCIYIAQSKIGVNDLFRHRWHVWWAKVYDSCQKEIELPHGPNLSAQCFLYCDYLVVFSGSGADGGSKNWNKYDNIAYTDIHVCVR